MAEAVPSSEDLIAGQRLASRRVDRAQGIALALAEARVVGQRQAVEARRALIDEGDCACESCVLEALGLPRVDTLGEDEAVRGG